MSKKNNRCDGSHCIWSHGEVRLLPHGPRDADGSGANSILCRQCYNHEMSYRKERAEEGIPETFPSWESLTIYNTDLSEAPPMGFTH